MNQRPSNEELKKPKKGINYFDIGLSNSSLNMTPQAWATKEKNR